MPNRIEAQAEPIPGYRLLERLGGGGFGEVWKVEAPGGLLKAIKFVYGDLETVENEDTVRASQELRSLERVKQVRHPFILSLERYEIVNHQLLIVTELADRSLWDRFRECRAQGLPGIPRNELLGYLTEAAEALDLMNLEHDLMHLDIKPQNLFLIHNHIKVADFGLVKDLEGLVASVTGGITPVYAAPETFDGYISRFSDQYSLAIVFQELLTGQRPFSGNNTRQLILQHLEGKPKLEALPVEDRPVVAKALSRDPNNRYPSCMEFIQALRSSGAALRQTPAVGGSQDTITQGAPPSAPISAPFSVPMASGFGLRGPAPEGITKSAVTPGGSASPTTNVPAPGYLTAEAIRQQTPVGRAESAAAAQQRVERTGPGVLQPALIIGLGQMGRVVVDLLKQDLHGRYGPLNGLPHLKIYSVDTDPETPPLLAGSPFVGNEDSILLKLNRPARYLRPRDTMPPVEQWLDTNILYRLPRNLVSSGIRAFGRLAFMEYAKSLGARIKRDVEAITQESVLKAAGQRLEVELRSSFPRVYLVAALGGGTGSGMFLDLAYLVRQQLRELGYPKFNLEAVLLLPPVDESKPADIPHANAFAALLELHHHMQAGQPYKALYETGVEPLTDPEPPFQRVCLMDLPDGQDDAAFAEALKVVNNYLNRTLLTPLGTAAESVRRQLHPATPYHSAGVRALASPRRPLIRRTGRRLGLSLVERWLRELPPELEGQVAEPIRAFLRDNDLDPTGIFEQLEAAASVQLGGRRVMDVLSEIAAPLRVLGESGFPDGRKVKAAFAQAEALLGSQAQGGSELTTPPIVRGMLETADRLARLGGPPLVFTLLDFINRPGLRLGAAEEAVRQAVSCFDAWLTLYEDQLKTLQHQMLEALEKLKADLKEFDRLREKGDRKRAALLAPPGEVFLRVFTLRLQQLLHERLIGVYVALRGRCSDQTKELRFSRNRLMELAKQLSEGDETALAHGPARPGLRQTSSVILPKGCRNLVQAVTDFLATITPEDLDEFDLAFAAAMERTLQPLSALCVTAGDALRPVKQLLQQEAEKHLERRLDLPDAAGLFLERHPDTRAAADALMTTFDETLPFILSRKMSFTAEFGLLMAPNTPHGFDLKALAREALPQVQVIHTPDGDEVVAYREVVGLQLHDLPQLGPHARAAYEMAISIEHYTPHSRQDVAQWYGPNLG